MRESVRLIIKNKEDAIINEYQSLIFIAKEGSLGKNFKEIRNTILILLKKMANKKI